MDYSNDDCVWVAVRVFDGEAGNQVSEHRGQMPVDVFRRITMNEMTEGWFGLDCVHWDRDGEPVLMNVAGRKWGYGSTVYIRVDRVTRIILLDDAFVSKLTRGK